MVTAIKLRLRDEYIELRAEATPNLVSLNDKWQWRGAWELKTENYDASTPKPKMSDQLKPESLINLHASQWSTWWEYASS